MVAVARCQNNKFLPLICKEIFIQKRGLRRGLEVYHR